MPTEFERRRLVRKITSDMQSLTREAAALDSGLREMLAGLRELGDLIREAVRREIEKDPTLVRRWQIARFRDPGIGILDVAAMDAGEDAN